jgi:hypothetical protein
MMQIKNLFNEFINSTEIKDELIYCLSQSQVESFVRFKFGFWLHNNSFTNINIIEINNIDLVVGIGSKVYFIEFGHLLNLCFHEILLSEEKVNSDILKLKFKLEKFINKVPGLIENKELIFCSISLFSDFELGENDKKIETKYGVEDGDINIGTFIKYGRVFNKSNKRFSYLNSYKKQFEHYERVEVINDKLYINWFFQTHSL